MTTHTASKLRIEGPLGDRYDEVLTPEALEFVDDLLEHFEPVRRGLLEYRLDVQEDLDNGTDPDFLDELPQAREPGWKVATTPDDLQDRRVEITGPVERKMMINALNSGASVFMADFEDANSPTWDNVVQGQVNLKDAVRRKIELTTAEGKEYRLDERTATLLVRPRGWHLPERHVTRHGEPISASLFDFGLYAFHNAAELVRRGSGPYFYLPKLENHKEARLWNEVFKRAQQQLGIPYGTIRATVLVENILAAFQMEEILWELRDHSAGLNAGRWDYIFSIIKKFRTRDQVLPDRGQVTMTVPFMHAYAERLVQVCHRHGAHAIGGMAAFIPNRREPDVTERAIRKVEGGQGAGGLVGLRRHLGGAPGPGAGGEGDLRPPPGRPAAPEERAARGRRRLGGGPAGLPGGGRRDHRGRGAPEHLGGAAVRRRLAAGGGRGGDLQPDGGHRHRGDLARPALAVALPRGDAGRRPDLRRRAVRADPGRGDRAARRARARDGWARRRR